MLGSSPLGSSSLGFCLSYTGIGGSNLCLQC